MLVAFEHAWIIAIKQQGPDLDDVQLSAVMTRSPSYNIMK
jgi:hypothetical protein